MEIQTPWMNRMISPAIPLLAEEERERIERQIREEERRRREEEAERRRQQIDEQNNRIEKKRQPTDEYEPKEH